MMRKIAIGLAAVTIATASSTLTASALPGWGTLGVANSGDDGFTTVGFAGSKACVGMKWGEKGPAPYGTPFKGPYSLSRLGAPGWLNLAVVLSGRLGSSFRRRG